MRLNSSFRAIVRHRQGLILQRPAERVKPSRKKFKRIFSRHLLNSLSITGQLQQFALTRVVGIL